MIFKEIPLLELLEFPEFPAEIVRLSNRGEDDEMVYYKFHVLVDLDTAVRKDCLNLKASIYKKKPREAPIPKAVKRASFWSRTTKRLEKNVQKSLSRKKDSRVAFRDVDLSRYLSNDLARLRRNIQTRQERNSLASRAVPVPLKDPFTVNLLSFSKPSTPGVVRHPGVPAQKRTNQKPLSTTVPQRIKVSPPRQVSFSKSILSIKKDPASISAATQNSLSKGTLSRPMISKVADFVFTPPRSLISLAPFKVTPKKQPITFIVRMRRSVLATSGTFYLDLELENSKGVKVSHVGRQILHSRILNAFLTPRFAPSLEAEYIKPGKISISLERNKRDRMCTRLKVFRRLSAIAEGTTDKGTPWVEVFDEPVGESGEFVFRDSIATSKAVIYRAVSYGENSKPSEKFSSTVVMPLRQFRVKQTGSLTAVPVLSATSRSLTVQVSVKDVPPDVVSVSVKRFNKTTASDAQRKASKGSGFEYVGGTPASQTVFANDIDDDGTVVFIDRKIKPGNNYVYVPVGVTRTGKEISGSSAALEVPLSPSSPKVGLTLSDLTIEPSSRVVTMELKGKFTDFGFSEIRNSLTAGQQADLFTADLLEDRDKFESLINFLVERENSKTGEMESFGIYETGKFSDDAATRAEKNIKNLESGVEYTYTVTALLRSPETLFPTLARKEIDTKTLLPFSRRVAKFQSPLALSKATLASTQRQTTPSAPSPLEPNDPLIAGRTNVQSAITVRVPLSSTQKPSVRIEKHKDFNRVIWVSDGVEKIDHFKVYVLSSGGRVLIDTVHCDAATSEFYYRHYDKDYAVEFQYMIQPVDLSYKDLKPILAKKVKPIKFRRMAGVALGSKLVRR